MIEFEQGSEEWLKWRQSKWCASEAGIIMMCAPSWMQYRTWDDLRLVKAGFAEYDAWTKAMFEHGHEREKEVRDWFNEKNNSQFRPACVESSNYPNMTASLDGLNDHVGCPTWIEIKCPAPLPDNRKRWYDGVREFEDLPDYHRWQVYHQYASLDSQTAELLYIIAPVDQEPIVIRKYFTWTDGFEVEELYGQWKKWAAYEQPGRDDADWKEVVSNYQYLKDELDTAQRNLADMREELIALSESGLSYGAGLKVIETERKGAVDKQQMRDLGVKCVCEEYRKPSTTCYQIRKQA